MSWNCARNIPDAEESSSSSSPIEKDYHEFEELVQLETIKDKHGRTIQYGTAGDYSNDSTPIVFFPPLEGTRRMLVSLDESLKRYSLRAVCVNRPGVEGTSWGQPVHGHKHNAAQAHLQQACDDICTVLDELEWGKNNRDNEGVGILCMCAGTPFALAFCQRYPQRVNGKILSLAPWVLPADCPSCKALHKFAAHHLPTGPISSVVGSTSSFFMNFFSKEFISKQISSNLSEQEKTKWDEKFKDWPSAEALKFVLGFAGGNKMDVAVCLSSSKDLGFEYNPDAGDNRKDIVIWIGDSDPLTSVESARWFSEQLGENTKLNVVPKGTHNGALFLLGDEFADSLHFLGGVSQIPPTD